MQIPKTRIDLEVLITNRVQESLHLDYKDSDALSDKKRNDISKDVSAFANSDGGVLVYGIKELDHFPVQIDNGVDDTAHNREWIENIITSSISPRIDGIIIHPIPIATGRSAYTIVIPKSFRGPHQERHSKRYYKRFNFKSEPMEDYEIADIRSRIHAIPPLINIDMEIRHGVMTYLVVANIGNTPAEDVQFKIIPDVPELTKTRALSLIARGSKFFPPGKSLQFSFGSALELEQNTPLTFDVEVSYFDRRIDRRVTDTFHINTANYLDSAIIESDVTEQGKQLQKTIEKLTKEVAKINDTLERLSAVANATGLNLSVSTIRNLKRLSEPEFKPERIRASGLTWQGFAEVLGVDRATALALYNFSRWPDGKKLEEIEGLSTEVIERAKAAFIFNE